MVRALVLLALGGAEPPGHAPPGHAPCRVLYARDFGTPPQSDPETPPRQRLRRKEQLLALAREVSTQHRLLHPLSGHPSSPDDPPSAQDTPGGLFRLPPGDPFPERVTVAWAASSGVALALLCDPGDNLALAELTLRRLLPRLLGTLRPPGPGTPLPLRPDAADALLARLLPHGEMLFLSHQLLQEVDRELGIKTSSR